MNNAIKKSSGKTSTILLVLGLVLFVVIVGIFVILKINAVKTANTAKNNSNNTSQPEVPKPVYDTTVGDVRFVFESATDLGNVLVSHISYQNNLTTTEKFIEVVVGAQNKSKVNIPRTSWDLGNVIDSEGRNFVPIDDYSFAYTPKPNLCGELLKPEFELVPCVKIYEVSKESTGLKVKVNFLSQTSSKKQEGLLDLIVK